MTATAYDTGKLRADALGDYRALVEAAANGKAPSRKTLQEALWAAGRNLETFDADVSRLRTRLDAAEALATRPAVESELAEAEGEFSGAVAAVERTEAEAQAMIAKARALLEASRGRRTAAKERLRRLDDARRRLETTACPRLRKQIADAEAEMVAPADALRHLEAARRRLASQQMQAERGDFASQPEAGKQAIARAQADVQAGENAERRLPGLERRLAELRAEAANPTAGMDWGED